jgi:hypothetical protein
MTGKHFAVAAIAALLMSSTGNAQNASDLLQKGLHLQEAAGDVDGAIVFFRQEACPTSNVAELPVTSTWRGHSCLQRRDSSRRSGLLGGTAQEGRDESRPGRQECLRHVLIAASRPSPPHRTGH